MSSEMEQLSTFSVQKTDNPSEESSSPVSPELQLRAPRSAWWEFFLFFSTLGFYYPVYLFRLIRELRAITGQPLSPWLWIFVPFVLLAQLFALPRLLELLKQVESGNAMPNSWGNWAPMWVIATCATTLIFNISERFSVPDWLLPTTIAISAILFAVLHTRVNHLRRRYRDRASFSGKENGFSIAEWITTIALSPVAIALLALILFYSELVGGEVIEKLDKGRVLHHEEHPFAISIPSGDWSLVEVGSHSDGSALVELEGSRVDMYYVVFYHGPGSSLDDISSFRTEETISDLSNANCTEQRSFLSNSLSLSSRIQCTGKNLGNPNIVISRTIETENGLYELYGNFTTTKMTYNMYLEEFLALEKGFGAR